MKTFLIPAKHGEVLVVLAHVVAVINPNDAESFGRKPNKEVMTEWHFSDGTKRRLHITLEAAKELLESS